MSFTSLGLIEPLLRVLTSAKYHKPTPIQAQAIPAVLAGKDVMGAAQTGTGKTAAFALPLLQRLSQTPDVLPNSVRVLVVTPTRELAQQVADSFRTYGTHLPLRVVVAYGGVSINPQMMALRKGTDVLVATPGRLLDLYNKNALKFTQVQTLVLDEADRMLELGFSNDIHQLMSYLPKKRQTLLFSATFSEEIRALANRLLLKPVSIEVSPRNSAAKSVRQWVVTVDKKRKSELFCHLLKHKRWPQVLVFVKTRKGVQQLMLLLEAQGVKVDSIHGDKTQPARLLALNKFKAGELQVLVATDVASRGLDIDTLPLVVNLDLPIVAEDYVHRVGRTGRAGANGQAISLVCADEAPQLQAIEKLLRTSLERREERGFEAEHRVPATGPVMAPRSPRPNDPRKKMAKKKKPYRPKN